MVGAFLAAPVLGMRVADRARRPTPELELVSREFAQTRLHTLAEVAIAPVAARDVLIVPAHLPEVAGVHDVGVSMLVHRPPVEVDTSRKVVITPLRFVRRDMSQAR